MLPSWLFEYYRWQRSSAYDNCIDVGGDTGVHPAITLLWHWLLYSSSK